MKPFPYFTGGRSAAIGTFRVLLCDAQHDARAALKSCLKGLFPHLALEEGEDGEHAVSAARAGVYDLILLDAGLPQIDGYQALREIRAHSMNQNSLIVMLTDDTGIEEIERAEESSADSHLLKPYHLQAVEDSILEILAYSV